MVTDEARRAFARVTHDLRSRAFYRHPYETEFVEAAGIDAWLERLLEAVDAGGYVPGPSPPVETAKAGFHVRPGVLLRLEDQLVYHLTGLRAAEVIGPMIQWSATTVRFSYRLASLAGTHWFQSRFVGWRNFTKVSLGRLKDGASHVLVSDVAGFYENIDIGRLVQELRAAGVDGDVCTLASNIWNKWCGVRRRGIPQGLSPSDLFAEFYLDPLDKALRLEGLDHLRYVDDIRIFTGSEREARLALHELERTLRDRGLNPQTAKTRILMAREARDLFARVDRVLASLSRQMAAELALAGPRGGYVDPSELRKYLRFDASDPKPEVVDRAWESFVEGAFGDFDTTLFHYLLARLGEQGSGHAQDYCLQLLRDRPEETDAVLSYFSQVLAAGELATETLEALADLVSLDDTLLYEHQRYLILRWLVEHEISNGRVLAAARRGAVRASARLMKPHWIAYVGDHTQEDADFGRLERALQEETDNVLRATYLFALRRAPAADRDLLYGRCRGESVMVDGAIKLARRRVQD